MSLFVFLICILLLFLFVCLFVTKANCELPVIVFFFLDFNTLPRILSTGLLSRSGQNIQ